MTDISIIIPVYNAQSFLLQCLNSFFKQETSANIEVIAIDDASNDDSLSMLKNYREKESRLKIIEHKENKRAAVARANGMKLSTAAYIMHVDADDYLIDGAIEKLYKKSKQFDVDVIIYDYVLNNLKGKKQTGFAIKKAFLTEDKQKVQKYFYQNSATKLVKKKLTENMIVGSEKINSTAEDLLYCTEILLKAKSFYVHPEVFYVGNVHENSFTQQSSSPEIMLENRAVLLKTLKKITSIGPKDMLVINNILNRIEKEVYKQSFIKLFSIIQEPFNSNELISSLKLFPEIDLERIYRIELAINSRRVSIYYNLKQYGWHHIFKLIKVVLARNIKIFLCLFVKK